MSTSLCDRQVVTNERKSFVPQLAVTDTSAKPTKELLHLQASAWELDGSSDERHSHPFVVGEKIGRYVNKTKHCRIRGRHHGVVCKATFRWSGFVAKEPLES